jgi:hypothetical protein
MKAVNAAPYVAPSLEVSGGKYSVRLDSDRLKLIWHDLEEKSVDSVLSAAFNAWHG